MANGEMWPVTLRNGMKLQSGTRTVCNLRLCCEGKRTEKIAGDMSV